MYTYVYLDFLGHHDLNPLKKTHLYKQVNMFFGGFNPCMLVSLDHHTHTVENKQCLNLNTPTTVPIVLASGRDAIPINLLAFQSLGNS